jgi:hypothetical protein
MLVIIKLRARICRASNTKPQQLRRFAVDRLKVRDVASRYYDELESELQVVQAQPLSLDAKCKKLNDVRRPFEPQVAMCRAKNGELLTNKNQVLARWKEHFEEHLNEGSETEQPTRPITSQTSH